MLNHQVAKKYGSALFKSAKRRSLLDKGAEQMRGLRQTIAKDRALLDFLEAPQIPDDKKLALIKSVFEPRLERLFLEFLYVIMEKHRISYLPDILDEFERLIKAEQGVMLVTVITAKPVSAEQENTLRAQLQQKTKMKIELLSKIDSSIIGGMILLLGGEIIDGSVRHQLDLMREQLERLKVA